MSDRDKAINRIRKLLAMTKDKAASLGEIENALAAAQRLMVQWSIEDEELIKSDKAKDHIKREPSVDQVGFSQWEKDIAVVVGGVTSTEPILATAPQSYMKCSMEFVGFDSDVAVACALYSVLLAEVRRMAIGRCGNGWTKRHSSYCGGVAAGLCKRVSDMKRAREANTTAIVLRKDLVVKQWMKDNTQAKTAARDNVTWDNAMAMLGALDSQKVSLDTNGIEAQPARKEIG